MNYFVKYKLDQTEHEEILNFLSSLSYYCIEQHPDWDSENEGCSKSFFICKDDNKVVQCFANIILSKGPFKIANINFGPSFNNYEVLTKSIQYLHNYFSSHGFIFFSIQLGTHISEKTELLEYHINKNLKVKYYFKPGNLWSSLYVDLTHSETEILKSFSKLTKRQIKSANAKTGLNTAIQKDCKNLDAFIDLYIKMHVFRKLPFNKKDVTHLLCSTANFIYKYNKGFFEYIYDGDILVGGLIVIFQGTSARYFKGATDPERRDIPIMHMGLFEAMKLCKANGFLTFDLWGYNHFVDDKNQIFYINRFKKGFSHNFTFFPKRMNFELKPFTYKLYISLRTFKMRISNLLMK